MPGYNENLRVYPAEQILEEWKSILQEQIAGFVVSPTQ